MAKLGLVRSKRVKHGHQGSLRRTLRFESLEDRWVLTPVTVNTLNDVQDSPNLTSINGLIGNPGPDGKISFREAIVAANADSAQDTIGFSVTGTINLTDVGHVGQLTISENLIINGPGSSQLTIRAFDPTPTEVIGDGSRILEITDASSGATPPTVQIVGLKLTGADFNNEGGAISSAGMLFLDNCVVSDNHAFKGGAIFVNVAAGAASRSILTIEDSVIDNNDAFTGGGVAIVSGNLFQATTDVISITRTTISNNDALSTSNTGGGGGLYAQLFGARLTVTESTISGNTAAANSSYGSYSGGGGGGIYAELRASASLAVDNTVVDGNTAINGDGGGIVAKAFENVSNPYPTPRAITITRSTISNNTANNRGGGLFAFNREGTETLVSESRVTGNHVPADATGGHRNGGGIYAYVWNGYDSRPIADAALKPKWTITGSTVDNNDASQKGGGIFVCGKFNGDFVATNSTISGNRTTDESNGAGGGMFIARFGSSYSTSESIDAFLRNVTVTQNVSALGGGVATLDGNNVRVRIANSIISENWGHQPAPNNLVGRVDVASFKHNLIGSSVQVRDLDGTIVLQDLPSVNTIPAANNNILFNNAPYLAPLADNGGPTPTHALLYEPQNFMVSPAIDAGSNALAEDPLTNVDFATDQRGTGFARSFNYPAITGSGAGPVDIGAYELAEICVSTTADDLDGNLSFGDLSLREAVDYANTAGVPVTICLPAGTYNLTIGGSGLVSQGDLDVSGNVTIEGDGPGLSIVAGAFAIQDRIFDVASAGILNLSGVTLQFGYAPYTFGLRDGGAVRVQNGGQFHLDYSAVAGNQTGDYGDGGGIYFAPSGTGSIKRSVITVNSADDEGGGLYVAAGTGAPVTLESTIIANNSGSSNYPDVFGGNRVASNGYNRFTSYSGFTPHANDYPIGPVDYVVTSVADTYDGTADPVNMSLRDAIHQANVTAGTQEIWLPAWEFVLTIDRGTNTTDTSVEFGDLDILDSVIILGIGPATSPTTSVTWALGLPADDVFELVGDYNSNRIVDNADYTIWRNENGQSGPNITADGDDDGDVDGADYDIWRERFGNTLTLDDVLFG